MSLIRVRLNLSSSLKSLSLTCRYFCDKSLTPRDNDDTKKTSLQEKKVESDDLPDVKKPLTHLEVIKKVTKIMPPEDDYRMRFFETISEFGHVKAKDLVKMDIEWFSDKEKTRDIFIEKAETFKKSITKNRMGHSEFIYAAMRVMKDYGVHRDLEAYRALIDILPKGVMVPRNIIQQGAWHYYKQQLTVIEVVTQMEENFVEIDGELEKLVIDLFGRNSYAWRKVARNLYWTSKFINANPFPLPEDMDKLDSLELAMFALKRMCPDLTTQVKAFSTAQVDGSLDKTWIASAQSPSQCELISELSPEIPLYVEGPLKVWLKHHSITYFMLTADVNKIQEEIPIDENDIARLPLNYYGRPKKESLLVTKQIHIQDDGIILALGATGTSSRDSLLSWVRILEQLTDAMKDRNVVFKIQAPITQVEVTSDSTQNS